MVTVNWFKYDGETFLEMLGFLIVMWMSVRLWETQKPVVIEHKDEWMKSSHCLLTFILALLICSLVPGAACMVHRWEKRNEDEAAYREMLMLWHWGQNVSAKCLPEASSWRPNYIIIANLIWKRFSFTTSAIERKQHLFTKEFMENDICNIVQVSRKQLIKDLLP